MEILKIKLQIFLGIIICVLIYQYIHKPRSDAQPEITMEMVQQQAASGQMNSQAKAAADQMMGSGDVSQFQTQLGQSGLIDN
jgi:uncharacterized protein YneF (UPF0154 family)